MAKAKDEDEVMVAEYEAEPEGEAVPATVAGDHVWKELAGPERGTLDVRIEGRDKIPEKDKPPTREELIAKIESEEKARREAEDKLKIAEQLRETRAIAEAAQRPAPAPQQQIAQQPGESDADFAKRVKENMFEDPVAMLDEYMKRKMGPVVSQFASGLQALARTQAEADPYFKKYGPEVDDLVGSRPDRYTNPGVYKDALEQVKARHINDIIADQVKEQLEKMRKDEETKEPAGRAFSERPGGAPRGTRAREIVTLTRKEQAEARKLGLTDEDYYRALHKRW